MWCHTVMCTHMEQQLLMHPKEKKRKEKKEEKYWQWDLQTVAHVKKHSEIFERIFIPKEKNDHFCIHLVSFKDWGSNDSKSSSIVIESCLWRAAIAAGMMVGLQPYSAKGTFVWKSRLLLPKQTVWIAEWSMQPFHIYFSLKHPGFNFQWRKTLFIRNWTILLNRPRTLPNFKTTQTKNEKLFL